jgi:two-component system sensor histidine kinase EvgS
MSDRPIRDPGRTVAGAPASSSPTRGIRSESDVLDPAVLDSLRRLGARSGRDVLGELTSLFLSTADAQVATAGELLDRADLPELARIAHALKGSGSVIGARRVSAAAVELEHTCGRPDRSHAGGSVAEAREALARFVEELEVFRRAVAALGLAP